jgi:hypothetical protein
MATRIVTRQVGNSIGAGQRHRDDREKMVLLPTRRVPPRHARRPLSFNLWKKKDPADSPLRYKEHLVGI